MRFGCRMLALCAPLAWRRRWPSRPAVAQQWLQAAANERETDWDILCQTADSQCAHGDACAYAAAADEIFLKNEGAMSQNALAFALRESSMKGPSKTTRTPLIVPRIVAKLRWSRPSTAYTESAGSSTSRRWAPSSHCAT